MTLDNNHLSELAWPFFAIWGLLFVAGLTAFGRYMFEPGVNSLMLKALMLLLSAFMAGVMGAFNAHYINFLEPDYAFSGLWTTLPIVAAIFGGYRTIAGPIVGAVVVYLVDQLIFKSLIASGHQVILGALLIGMILWSPGGLLPPVVAWFARRKHADA